MLPDKKSSLLNKIIMCMKIFRSPKKTCWKVSSDTVLRNELHKIMKQKNQQFVCIYGHIKNVWINTEPSEAMQSCF